MKRVKILLMLAFASLSAIAWGQDGTIDKGSGWLYFSGVPGTTPNVSCCAEIAMNVLTREAYVWNRDSSEWELLLEMTQGLAAPSGDPGSGPKLFLNRDDGLLYRWTGAAWEAYGSGAALSDGDYGDIDVSGTGTVMTIDTGVVGPIELASTAVTPGSYTFTSITVDGDGRITAASSGTETNQTIDTLFRVGSIIYASLSGDGEPAKQLNLSVFAQSISLSGDTLCISGTGTCVVLPATGVTPTAVVPVTAAGRDTIDFNSEYWGIFHLDLSGPSQDTLVFVNPMNGGQYVVDLDNVTTDTLVWPVNLLDANEDTLGSRIYTAGKMLSIYWDGTNYYTPQALGVEYVDTTVVDPPLTVDSIFYWFAADSEVNGFPRRSNSELEGVERQNDLSGLGHHVTQSSDTKRPVYKTSS
ncbi:MAG: hypothetical protein IPH04_14875 [Saprospirales bacterium]|nr:hypothetical protein [Saprospirales bacterium]